MSDPGHPTYLDRLAARSASVGSVLCLGLDPDPAALPDTMVRFLAHLRQTHGGAAGLAGDLGIDSAVLEGMRAQLLS